MLLSIGPWHWLAYLYSSTFMENGGGSNKRLVVQLLSAILKTYPYENRSFLPHLEMTDATSPASNAVQSKNMWNESDIRPRLKKRNTKSLRAHFLDGTRPNWTIFNNESVQRTCLSIRHREAPQTQKIDLEVRRRKGSLIQYRRGSLCVKKKSSLAGKYGTIEAWITHVLTSS